MVTVVLDGLRPGDGPHPTFGVDQPAEAVAALMRENFLPETRFVTGFLPVLVETGGRLVLVDTGLGAGGRANGMGLLRERMGVGTSTSTGLVFTRAGLPERASFDGPRRIRLVAVGRGEDRRA